MTPADLLAFEATDPSFSPDKRERIRRELGITPARYVVLHRAAESAGGIVAPPITARRVREQAARRAQARLAHSRSAA